MKKLLVFILVLIFVLAIAGCKSDAPGGEIQLGREFDFSGITQVQLTNCHNGQATIITDSAEAMNGSVALSDIYSLYTSTGSTV